MRPLSRLETEITIPKDTNDRLARRKVYLPLDSTTLRRAEAQGQVPNNGVVNPAVISNT